MKAVLAWHTPFYVQEYVWTHRGLFGECSGKEKRKNRRLLHGGLERRTAHGRHRIPQHVNSKHRT